MNCIRLEYSVAFKWQERSALGHNKNHRIFICLFPITHCCSFENREKLKPKGILFWVKMFEDVGFRSMKVKSWNLSDRSHCINDHISWNKIKILKKVKIPNNLYKETKYPSKHKFCYVPLAPALQILLWVWQLLSWQKQNKNLNFRIHLKAQIIVVWNERTT